MNNGFETRLRALEDDLERRLTAIEDAAQRREELQESRHEEQKKQHTDNSGRLKKIEDILIETAVYFKVGRWVMVAVWTIGSAVITALTMKWLGAK